MIDTRKPLLVLDVYGIGDVVMSIPALYSIKRETKGKVVVAVRGETEGKVLGMCRYRWGDGMVKLREGRVRAAGRIRREKINMVISLGINPAKTVAFSFASGIFQIYGAHPYRRKKGLTTLPYKLFLPNPGRLHKEDLYLELLRKLGFNPEIPEKPWISPPFFEDLHEYLKKLKKKHKRLIALHVESVRREKEWPLHHQRRWIEMMKKDFGVVLVGKGKKDIGKILGVEEGDFVDKLTLEETSFVINEVDILIGGDTGLMHIGEALSKPMVVLFGPTHPEITAPRGERIKIIKKDLPCSPCHYGRYTNCRNPVCMQEITPEEVRDACYEIANTLH